jgi:branched-chain amino acid aminotransferase
MSSTPFPEDGSIWKNGEIIPWKEATIHVMSHVVHYGSSVFEGIRCYSTPDGPMVLRLQDTSGASQIPRRSTG